MNSPRARFLDTVSGSGRSSFFWDCIGYMGVTVEHWHNEGLPAEVEACGFLGQFGKPTYDYFGLDWVNFAPISHHYSPWFETVVVADEGETEVIMDECGVVLRRSKKSLSMPQYIEYPVRDEKTYEDLLFRRNAASPERWDSVKWEKWRRETGGSQSPIAAFIVGFFAIVRELMGVEEGLVAFYTNPGLVHRILRDHCDFCIELIRRALQETHLDFCFLWEDMSYKNGMLISPTLFEEFIAPEATRFTDALRHLGLRDIIVDSDGDITELIPLYIRCGVNGFQPFEVQAGMNILEVRDKYPDLLIVGGIDKLAVARGGNVLENEILNKVGPMIDRGRYIPSLDHQAHPEMSLMNYLRYVKTVESMLAQAESRVPDLTAQGIRAQ